MRFAMDENIRMNRSIRRIGNSGRQLLFCMPAGDLPPEATGSAGVPNKGLCFTTIAAGETPAVPVLAPAGTWNGSEIVIWTSLTGRSPLCNVSAGTHESKFLISMIVVASTPRRRTNRHGYQSSLTVFNDYCSPRFAG